MTEEQARHYMALYMAFPQVAEVRLFIGMGAYQVAYWDGRTEEIDLDGCAVIVYTGDPIAGKRQAAHIVHTVSRASLLRTTLQVEARP